MSSVLLRKEKDFAVTNTAVVIFAVSLSERKRYCSASVCLCVCPPSRDCVPLATNLC